MSFKEIFEESFLSGYSSGVEVKEIIVSVALSCIIGLYIFLIYRIFSRNTFYSKSFNMSLVLVAVITSAIMLTIQSNIVMSLGMCGALSIVRFRTAIKDSMDLAFLYWAISAGIICGAGLTVIAIVLCLVITVLIVILNRYPMVNHSMLLVVNSERIDNDAEILKIVGQYSKHYTVKSKSVTPASLNIIVEVSIKADNKLVNDVIAIAGVTYASLVAHDGEVTVQGE